MGEALSIPRVGAVPLQGRCWDALQGLSPTPELNVLGSGGMGAAAAWPLCLTTPSSLLHPLLMECFLMGYPLGPVPEHPAECQAGRANGRLHLFSPSWLPAFWAAEVVLNHCKLQRTPTALSHSPGKHFITRLYFFPNRYYILYSENTNPTSSPGEKSSIGNLV